LVLRIVLQNDKIRAVSARGQSELINPNYKKQTLIEKISITQNFFNATPIPLRFIDG
jgi:hypothetical protein